MNEQQCIGIINGLLTQGDLAMQRGNIDAAKSAFQRAKDMSREISSGQNTGFAIACDKLGDIARWSGEYSTAREQYHQALPIFRDLASTNTEQRRDVSLCLSKLGELNLAEKNLSAAEIALEEHYKIAQQNAASDPSDCELQRDLAGAHGRLQLLAMARSNLPEAVKHAEAAHTILEKLVGIDSSNIGWVQDLAGSNCMFASLLLRTGDKPRAMSMLTKGFGKLKQLDQQGRLDTKGKRLLAQLNDQLS
ncbi:MAG TPA: hypothetical protein PLX89_04615 [Verrucomicrobiota bacterium]|nr:hypothetical protein [Verrucomicrobiales bacterium]HRI12269.1 hypothetical protein [Verrucomicrobiota bacterium]